jgi:hypothetical protein
MLMTFEVLSLCVCIIWKGWIYLSDKMYTFFAWNICFATKFMIVQIWDEPIDPFVLPIQLTAWLK